MQYFQLDPPTQLLAGTVGDQPFYFDCATCDAKEPPIAGILARDEAAARSLDTAVLTDPPRGPRHAVFCAACFAKQISPPDVGTPGTQSTQTTETENTMNATVAAPAAPRTAAPAANLNTRSVLFTKELDRKNAVRFQEVAVEGQAPVCGTLYLQKWFCRGAQNIRVSIELA